MCSKSIQLSLFKNAFIHPLVRSKVTLKARRIRSHQLQKEDELCVRSMMNKRTNEQTNERTKNDHCIGDEEEVLDYIFIGSDEWMDGCPNIFILAVKGLLFTHEKHVTVDLLSIE